MTATHKKNINKINGFNERYGNGIWYDDDDFIIRMSLITNVTYVTDNNILGIHQYHNSGSSDMILENDFDQNSFLFIKSV